MADVFVSYAREDRAKIKPFVELLEQQGWSVWWDREVVPGHSFGAVIDKEITAASCVVVFWSGHSTGSQWVQGEANEALERGVLIPVLLEDVRVPLVFRRLETVPLYGWPGREDPAELQRVVAAIGDLIGQRTDALNLDHSRRKRRPYVAAWLTALVLLLVALSALIIGEHERRGDTVASEKTEKTEITDERHISASRPVASIAILPFEGLETEIAPELNRLLSAGGAFYVQHPDHVEAHLETPDKVPLDARYSLQGAAENSRLTLSLFDRQQKETLWNKTFQLEGVSLPELTQAIVSDVARVFNRPEIKLDDISHSAYVTYLQAKAQLRQQPELKGLERAEELFLETIENAPRFSEGYAGLCETYALMYDETGTVKYFEEAERRCFRAATLSDKNVHVDIALGKLYRVSGRHEKAIEHFKSALASAPFSAEILRELALVEYARANVEEAVELLENAKRREPNYWKNYGELASIYFETGRFSLAAREFESMQHLVADQARVLNNLGSAYYMAENFDRAIEAWKASLAESRNVNALSNLGSAYYFNRDYKQAVKVYEEAAEMRPNDPRLWANIGEAAMQLNRDVEPYFKKVLEVGKEQLAINQDSPALLAIVASSHAALGEREESLRHIDRALSLAQDDVYVLYHVAVAFARLNKTERRDDIIGQMLAMGYSETLVEQDANFEIRR